MLISLALQLCAQLKVYLRVKPNPDVVLQVIPRSVLFAQFEGVPYLLCALGDGHLFTFHIKAQTGTLLSSPVCLMRLVPSICTSLHTSHQNSISVVAAG